MKPIVIFALICFLAIPLERVIAQKKLDKSHEKLDVDKEDTDNDDDHDDHDDNDDNGDDDDDDNHNHNNDEDRETVERLPHERNQGPVFERQPLDVTVVLGREDVSKYLQCSASQTFSIRVRCSSQHPSQSGRAADFELDVFPLTTKIISDFVNPYSGIRQMEIQADIGDTVLHRFHIDRKSHNITLYCVCQALSSKGHSTSRVATIKFTIDPNKAEFPLRRTISYGEKVLLECPVVQSSIKLPKGSETSVFWLLNGAPLIFDDNVNPEGGDLLILRAKVENEGNYTCGIKTVGANGKEQIRHGETVSIEVKANGNWSPWGAWSECSSRCARGHRSRTRSCTNPPPRNGGKDCNGNYIEKTECVSSRRECSTSTSKEKETDDVDIWGPWSAWSDCGTNCKRQRQRRCVYAIPKSSRKSSLCEEKDDHMSESCTGGECKIGLTFSPGLHGPDSNSVHDHPASAHEQGFIVANLGSVQAVAMVIGMALAAIILAFTFIIAIRFWPRHEPIHNKRQPPHPFGNVPVNALATSPADITMSLDPRCQEYLAERKMDPAVTIPLLQQLYTPNICAASLTPMQARATFTTRSHTPSSTSKTTRSECGSQQSAGQYGQEYDLIYDTIPDECSDSGSLSQTSSPFTACAMIGPEGGRVSLDELGVCLTLPPGAIAHSKRKVFLSVLNSGRDLPAWLKDKFSVLSAVVECGPSDVDLVRPAILSFDHCACEPAKWNVHLMSSGQSSNRNYSSWKKKLSLESPEAAADIFCHVDENFCHVQAERLASFVLCGESKVNTFATKSSKVLAFLSKRRSVTSNERTLKVHCVEDTRASVQAMMALHEENYTLAESPRSMQLHDGGANLCVAFDEETLPEGWKIKSGSSLQEIPFRKVWSTMQSAHCTFTLACPTTTSFSAHEVSFECRVTVYQRGNQSHRQVLNLNSSATWQIYRNVFETIASHHSVKTADDFKLPADSRKKIAELLDTIRDDGRDWRMLAQYLGMSERNSVYFAKKTSPTSYLLDLWEASHRGVDASIGLLVMLRSLGRPEITTAAENPIGGWV